MVSKNVSVVENDPDLSGHALYLSEAMHEHINLLQ